MAGIIAVSATDDNDQLAGFSQFGLTTVDVAAPGVDVLSTTLGGGYGLNSGTSMASPHVAGVVALMAGYAPGATVQQLKSAILLGADPLASLTGTSVTGARLNAAKSLTLIGAATGAGGLLSNTDVDIYQFKLGVGERAIVDIDSEGSGLDSVLQIFDSRGIAQEFVNASGVVLTASDNDAAPGEAASLDSYADFTATQPGVYYAAVSSVGNSSYDPLSFADRKPGDTTGAYRISISARHLQDFVITAQDASAYTAGETFTIFGVPDIDSTGSSGRTFEFVFGIGGPTDPNNIPINLEATWRFPDVARAIAKAINEGDAGQPVLPNSQALPNGNFGLASPLPAVTAVPLGGLAGVIDANLNDIVGDRALFLDQFVDYDVNLVSGYGFNHLSDREIERLISGPFREINQGLELFTRRNDGFLFTTTTTIGNGDPITITTSMGNLGIGHDRDSTNPSSQTSIADGTTEKFVVVKNAAYIDGNGAILVDPDQGDNHNLDQLLPESGVLATRGASPTILNNVFFNLQTPIVAEESRRFPLTGGPAPYGTNNPDEVIKPGEVIIGGSIFQYDEPGISHVRFGTGIQSGPTNVPNTALDLNFDIADGVQLFVNGQAGNYLPSPNSPLIDSSIDTLPERPRLLDVKAAVGISASPVLAPNFDLVGLLRVDDPNVAPPSSQGQNVFKDRGALERADFEGPTADLADPVDNDSLGIDQDKSVSVVQLESGVYRDFRIQLSVDGVAVDDNTVVNSVIEGLRQPGSVLVLFENGRRLLEGLDYTFDYNATSDEIVLTPLAGVWKNDVVYEMSINNRDRFAVVAPSGDQVADGDIFTISDADGGLVVYEFESGYRLQVPQGLTLQIPLAGGGFGGIADGDRFAIVIGSQRTTFEFDRNGNTLAGNIAVPFVQGASQAEMANVVLAALQATSLPIAAVKLDDTQVFIGAAAGVRLDSNFTAINQPATTLALKIPALGPRPGGITDGQTFSVSDGRRTITFEYDLDGSIGPNRVAIDFRSANTAADLTTLTQRALANSPLAISPEIVASDLIHIGLSANGSAVVAGSNLELLGVARTPADGETFTLSGNGTTATFEFTVDGSFGSGNIPLTITLSDTQDQIASIVAAAITDANLGFTPDSVGDGNIALGGTSDNSVDVSSSPSLSLFGTPGVRSNTRLEIVGPLVLQVPAGGAGEIDDNSLFSITNSGRTVNFEFDSDSSGPSAPNNQVIPFNSLSTVNSIAESMAVAISTAGLGIFAKNLGAGQVSVGNLDLNQVNVGTSSLTLIRGVVADGETFTIDNGDVAFTFEFEDVDVGNGFNLNNIPILFSFTGSTAETLAASMKAAIEGTTLGLTTNVLPGGILELNATPRYTINTTNAPTLIQSGVPGGANPVLFIQDPSFTGEDMTRAMLEAIANTQDSPLVAAPRGGDTFFVENAISISPEIDSFFIRGVADLAGNLLKPNRIDDQTAFTILMPGVALDYGDAPDPLSTTAGRYATKHVNDGARHVIVANTLGVSGLPSMPIWLGSTISAELDGQPSPLADADNDDGVVFSSSLGIPGVFNRNIFTTIDVTLMNAGFVDGWIDFNADGDWDDPGEHILNSVRFTAQSLTQTFQITVPSTAPELGAATTSIARFRSSSSGGLIPSGLAVDGEVEDYAITIVPGTPPTAVNDVYPLDEDTSLSTTDATGSLTPSFTVDDGIAANDTDPEGGPLGVEILDPPAVGAFTANTDGTFTYTPPANFNGPVTFTYRVNDGVLVSNNIGTVTLLVREINDAPMAVDDSVTLDEDQVLDIDQSVLLANDSAGSDANEDGQTLVITSVESVSTQGGTVSLTAGRVIYTPPSNYSGPDEFVYTVTDNGTNGGVAAPLSSSATVSLIILDKNDPPITAPFSTSTQEDTSVLVDISAVIADDEPGPIDEASQSLQFVGVQAASSNGGQVEVVGGQIQYTPPADFVGIDTFFYEIEDNGLSGGVADPQTAVGTVSVTVTGVNDAPRVADPFGTETMQEDEGTRLLSLEDVFFDPDVFTSGDTLTYQIVSNSNSMLVNPVITGSQLELQTNADQNGQSILVVRATDSSGASTTDTLTLNVVPVNDTPRLVQALPDLTVAEDSTSPQLVLTPQYFFDPDVTLNGDQLTFAIVSNSNPLLVTPVINGGTLVMNLSPNQSGVATISVSATDADGQTISDTFNLVVTSINDVPITQPDSYTVAQGQTLVTTDPRGLVGGTQDDGVLANDRDPEGDTMTAILVDAPKFASAFTLNPNGTFTYSHRFSAGRQTDTFTYQATDGTGSSAVTTVTIDIGAPPPPPHQNPTEAMDVNADGFISPIDALLIINFLNNNDGDGSVGSLPPPPPYRDVNGDNFITPIDALMVINILNNSLASGGEGEATLGTSDMASGFAYQEIVSSSSVNARIGMRVVKREENLTYGPDHDDSVFMELGQVGEASMVDTSWLSERETDSEGTRDMPVDLALVGLLGDLDDSEEA